MTPRDDPGFRADLHLLLSEVDELLSATEENLVQLEKRPQDQGLLQEVFRAMHTVKGGAATLGLEEAVMVSHQMEAILDTVRSEGKAATDQLIDSLFLAVDWLRAWQKALLAGEEPPPWDHLIGASASQDSEETSAGTFLPSGETEEILREAQEEGKDIQVLKVYFDSDTPLLSVRCFQVLTLVEETAPVIASSPTIQEIEAGEVSQTLVIYLCAEDGGALAESVARANQDVVNVSLGVYVPPQKTQTEAAKAVAVKRSDLGKTVRVDVGLLDFLMNMIGELVIDRTRLTQVASELMRNPHTAGAGSEVNSLASHLQRTSGELQEGIMRARLLPVRSIFSKFPRMIRDLGHRCGKQVNFEIRGENTEIDRTVLESIDDPLIHILRNAIDHGIELPEVRIAKGKSPQGHVVLSASHEENQVVVRVRDDGAGVEAEQVKRSAVRRGLITPEEAASMPEKEALELIFAPGFSTTEEATDVSGRGVGMDVVRANLERVNGQVEVRTRPGKGTLVTMRLPLTLAIMRALLVWCGDETYAISTSSVEEVVAMGDVTVHYIHGNPSLLFRDRVVPLFSLEGALWASERPAAHHRYAIVVKSESRPLALGVDGFIGEEEVVVKGMGPLLSRLKGIAGATVLAEGDPAIILDVNRVV